MTNILLVLIAGLALCVSVYSMRLLRRDFIVTHRPYVHVVSRLKRDGNFDLKSVLVCCSNAPARMLSQEFSYLLIKRNRSGEETDSVLLYKKEFPSIVIYPSESPQHQLAVGYDFSKEVLDHSSEGIVRRKVKIDYKELSSKRTYFFEGYWDFNMKFNVWENSNIFGN